MADRKPTSTSNFGVSRRENHDASAFYARFQAPEISKDDTVLMPSEVDVRIGKPIKLGDSRAMADVPTGSVALVVTSPPYFAGKQYEEDLSADGIPSSYREYLELLEDVFAECARTLEPGGRIAVNVANLGRKPYRSLSADITGILQDRLRLLLRGEIIWQKGEGASGSCAWGSYARPTNPTFRDITERVIVASKGRFDRALNAKVREARGLPFESTVTADRFMEATLDVWKIPPESARRVDHPAPFPVELPEWLIDLYTYENDLVLDPFMGSGSTMVAAVRRQRRYVGYDTEEEYVAIAEQRVAEERARRPAIVLELPLGESGPSAASVEDRTDDADDPVVDQDTKDANFQRKATEEGKAAQAIAEKVLVSAGFRIIGRNARLRGLGMTMNFVALDERDEEWYFDVSGAFSSARGGLRRTDTLWKSLGRAHVLANSEKQRTPLILLTSHLPRASTDGDRALHAATADAFFDAMEMLDEQDQARLSAYAQGEHDGRPLVGFWTAEEIEGSRRWASP
jgi:site-specific DNA-methyltransferase (adenine-specific)